MNPATLHSLADRAEQASADQQREVLMNAFYAIHGDPMAAHAMGPEPQRVWIAAEKQFLILLRAGDATGRYESAAMTLVPEGWVVERASWQALEGSTAGFDLWQYRRGADGKWVHGHCERTVTGSAATPALALTAASLRSLASKAGEE